MLRRMRGAALSHYAETAAELGLDARAMLRSLEVDSRILTDSERRFPAEKLTELLEASAKATDCDTFGLRMAEHRRLAQYGPISLLLRHQPSMRDALMAMVRYQRMLNEALLLSVEDHGNDLVVIREELVTGGPPQSMRQAYELAVGTRVRVFGGPSGPILRPLSVHFTHGPPRDLTVHRRVFGPHVEFNSQFNGVTCRRADMDAPIAGADMELAEHAERFIRTLPGADDTSLVGEVQKAIHVLLPFDGATVSSVASRLGVSIRTLQRRLAEDGAEFSSLLNEIRRDHAVRYLANRRVPLSQIAGLVGYSRGTSFGRWFAGEFGVTPSEWRTAPRQ
jgi:AraC-like DNA-binding protein